MNEIFMPSMGAKTYWDNLNSEGRKGPFRLEAGERGTIINLEGQGVIRKLGFTFDYLGKYLHPENRLRNKNVWIEIYWDGSEIPAVSSPIGDFFGHIMGRDVEFENCFFGDPSGRTFRTNLPMPFRKSVRIDIINKWHSAIVLYHDLRATLEPVSKDACYLHAHYSETITDEAGKTHVVLPMVKGKGRYLGTHLGFYVKPENGMEWQHGKFKFAIDSDKPNMLPGSLDDYCGSSWDYDHVYHHKDGGLLFSEYFPQGGSEQGLYCYHREDSLFFDECCEVTYTSQMAGPATRFVEWYSTDEKRLAAIKSEKSLDEVRKFIGEGHGHFEEYVGFFTNDDIYTVAFYYLDKA